MFKFKQQITGQSRNDGTQNVEITVPLKYLRNFWGTLEMLLVNWKINVQLKWSENSILVTDTAANQVPEFKLTHRKLYVPVVTIKPTAGLSQTQNFQKIALLKRPV